MNHHASTVDAFCASLDELEDADLWVVIARARNILHDRGVPSRTAAAASDADELTPVPETDPAPYAAKTPRASER